MLPWELCYPGSNVTPGVMLPWELCYPGSYVTLGVMLPRDLCYPGHFWVATVGLSHLTECAGDILIIGKCVPDTSEKLESSIP